ncbi:MULTISPECIES: TlpA disulfide reductase family protein [unclassified Salinibacterium]|uniref:TlpA family protein disulfide reductase n=1 Tax=unclassified Salinibacterium TaxID=2632331 RepID=UPI0018CD1169|nr:MULTISPECIES: TlpA disulfide reductase family protein [unclassified Salinibacterium]MBH0055040.1 TlpA family protein disulfide reductase [Salinibacterium sp. SWN139]MBH0083818.1 TlpA family protein disulfide reductase [Salinibacterium sp. SWN167]
MNRRLIAAVVASLALFTVSCSGTTESLAQQYENGSEEGYISGDGSTVEIPADSRDEPVTYEATLDTGETVSSDDFAGSVYVVNFWYSSCPPCRLEAPDLAALSEQYTEVPFLGVNVSDTAETSLTFADEFGIPYASVVDATTAGVQLAFAGSVPPNAVPTTLVVDREGRVAARISGLVRDPSILAAMMDSVIAEEQ